MNLNAVDEPGPVVEEPLPKITIAREKVLEEAKSALEAKGQKKGVSLVVIGIFMLASSQMFVLIAHKAMSTPVNRL